MALKYKSPPRTPSRTRRGHRQRPPLSLEECQYHRLKPGHHADGQFWNSLSRIHLTRRALKALNRRNGKTPTRLLPPPQKHCESPFTRQNYSKIQQLARHGGLDLSDLRGFSNMYSHGHLRRSERLKGCQTPAAYQISTTQNETPTSKTTPYSANFRQRMEDQGMMLNDKPQNWAEIKARLAEPRRSASSQMCNFIHDDFSKACDRAVNETTVRETAKPIIMGTDQTHYGAAEVLFNNLAPIDPTLSMAKPDWYDGAYLRTVPHRVRRDIGQYIIPAKRLDMPAVPNFFSEWKSNDCRTSVAQNQVCHDSVIGARAMHELQNYGSAQPQYDGNAYCLSTTFQDGLLKVFSTHMKAPKTTKGQPTYHTAQLNAFAMTGNPRSFQEGVTAFRNARDCTAEWRDSFIAQAKNVADRKRTR